MREFVTCQDNAKYEEKQRNLSSKVGIASSRIPATGEINLSLANLKEQKFI